MFESMRSFICVHGSNMSNGSPGMPPLTVFRAYLLLTTPQSGCSPASTTVGVGPRDKYELTVR